MNPNRRIGLFAICMAALVAPGLVGCQNPATTAWPQWGGPQRNFSAPDVELASEWPAKGPKKLWSRKLGDGYSTVVTDTERLYTMYRNKRDQEVVVAIDPATGFTKWEHRYDTAFINEGEGEDAKNHVTKFGVGPQSTPLVAGDRVYALGFTGVFNCLDKASGKLLWSHDIYEDFGANFMRFGYAASPVAYEDVIILPVGGKNSDDQANGVMAFDATSGKVLWRSTDLNTGYASPILVNLDGEDLLVALMNKDLFALNPRSGDIRWQLAPADGFGAALNTPVWCPGNKLFYRVRGDEEQGGVVMQLAKNGSVINGERVWFNNKVQGGLNNPVLMNGAFYGPSGEFFAGYDMATGEILWKERDYPQASCIGVGAKLLILDEEGMLTLATPTREGLTVHSKAKLLEKIGEGGAWAAPMLSGSTLFLRDNKTLMAVDLGA